MSEDFASYWDVDVPLVERELDYHQIQAGNFREAVSDVYGEDPFVFSAIVDGEPIKDIDEFLDLEYGRVNGFRSEHLSDKGQAEIEYPPGDYDTGLVSPDYRLRLHGSTGDRDIFEHFFGRRMRRKGFRVLKDVPRFLE